MIRLLVTIALLVPGTAVACPVCAAGQSRSDWMETALVAGMIAAPMVIAALVFRWVRRSVPEEGRPR